MKYRNGYIALLSTILISAILLGSVLESSYGSFSGRFNILDSQYKEQSFNLANSCLEIGLIRLAENPTYRLSQPADSIPIGAEYCQILSVNPDSPGSFLVQTKSTTNDAVSVLQSKISFNDDSISIQSITEI